MKEWGVRKWLGMMVRAVWVLAAGQYFGATSVEASENPYDGYSTTDFYYLAYSDGSFAPGNTSDVKIDVSIDGHNHSVNLDTGSRGFYLASEGLDSKYGAGNLPGQYFGEVQLTSSGRAMTGWWTPIDLEFKVTDKAGGTVYAHALPNTLVVTTLSAQTGRTAEYGIDATLAQTHSTVNLVGGGTVAIQNDGNGKYSVSLTDNQQISYSGNVPGLIKDVSNFGIGFDLTGAPGGTGPIGSNENQIYNPFLNLDKMKDGTLVAGYIVQTEGVQLGLTINDRGYAYTTLNSTGLQSTNSVPDWQTPMGQVAVNGVVNGPGSIVMDTGIDEAFISAPDLTIGDRLTNSISVYLMNSGGAVGYHIDVNDPSNELNPTYVEVVKAGTNGIYSQNQLPYQSDFFNTGRNAFEAFNMLYDAENGYMGLLTNSFGATNENVFFSAQAGGYPNPIPESRQATLLLLSLLVLLPMGVLAGRKRKGTTGGNP